MSESDPKPAPKNKQSVIKFPQSKPNPKPVNQKRVNLGISKLAQQLGYVESNLKGHWCSSCKGIWYGYLGECECPVCGNRQG